VLLNLIFNGIEAMSEARDGSRELLIRTEQDGPGGVLVVVQDSGPGLTPESVDRLFGAFYTTKPDGMGMGLLICRSIIEAHGGRMWAAANRPRGAVFSSTSRARERLRHKSAGDAPFSVCAQGGSYRLRRIPR